MSSPDDLIIRPVLLQDAEALWTMACQEGVIETTMALPSLRLEQRMKSLSELGENDHCMVAERAGKVAGVAGLTVGLDAYGIPVTSIARPTPVSPLSPMGRS